MDNVRDKMIVDNLRLVSKVMKDNSLYYSSEYEDIFSEGVLGLIRAVDTFDISKGFKFSTYAYRCISSNIVNYLEKKKKKFNTLSLDLEYDFLDNVSLVSVVRDEDVDIEEDFIRLEEYNVINKLLTRVKLSDRDRFIVLLHFGFYNGRIYSRYELAEMFNMTHQNVSLILKKFLLQIDKLIIREYGKDELSNRDKFRLYSRNRNNK